MPGVQGAIGGGIASAIGGAFAGMGSFAGKGLLQAGTHALSGGLQTAAFGGNFWQGAASSGIALDLSNNSVPNTGEIFSSNQDMRDSYNSSIGIKDNLSMEQVENKINTTVELGSERNLPKGYSLDSNNGMIKHGSSTSGGITTNVYKGGFFNKNHSSIFISPGIKGYPLALQNGIFKHEFMHAWHWNINPNIGDFNKFSERATSSFSLAYEKSFGFNSWVPFRRATLFAEGGTYYPSSYSWRNFNKIIPTWLK